jgi:hypothetical protein
VSWHPAFGQIASPSEKSDRIGGTVVNSVTHEPIPRALVYSPDNRFATMTDSEGRFEFNLPQNDAAQGDDAAGSNRPTMLVARKVGYLSEANSAPQSLSLYQSTKELTIALMPEAFIVGKVSLPTSEPPDRIQLEIYQRQVAEGRARWVLARSANTKSNGEFRFAELLPGTYKLLTRELLDQDPATQDPATIDSRRKLHGYPPVYYSAATGFAAASEIHLSAGETAQANLTLVRQAYYNVKIPVANAQPGLGVAVVVYPAGQRGPGFALGYNSRDQAIEGMLPNGTYTVDASLVGQNNKAMAGSLDITINGVNLTGPAMALIPATSIGIAVKEEFSSESGTGTANTGMGFLPATSGGRRLGAGRYLNVMLEPSDDFGLRRGAVSVPTGGGENALVLENVEPGRYFVRVTSSRGFAASIRSGTTDLRDRPLEVGVGGSASPIEITMRDDSAEIDGVVEGVPASGTPGVNISDGGPELSRGPMAPPAHVYCIPMPDSGGAFTEVYVSADGSFQSSQLPPGAYRVLAFDRPQVDLEYRNPEAMRAYDSKGPVVRVAGGQQEHLRLQLISAE